MVTRAKYKQQEMWNSLEQEKWSLSLEAVAKPIEQLTTRVEGEWKRHHKGKSQKNQFGYIWLRNFMRNISWRKSTQEVVKEVKYEKSQGHLQQCGQNIA